MTRQFFKYSVCCAALTLILCATQALAADVTITFDDGTYVDGPDDVNVDDATEDVLSMGYRFHDFNLGDPAITNAQVDAPADDDVPGENRLRSRDFGGAITMTQDAGNPFDLTSFRLSNFTFNAGHTHGMEVTYNFADSTSETAPVFLVGTDIPGDREMESADIVVNKTNLTSVVFSNTQRLVFIDDIVVTAVPEPTTAALGLFTVLAACSLRRRVR